MSEEIKEEEVKEESKGPNELDALKQTVEKVKPVLETMNKWGLDAQTYAQNADAAFSVINDLIEKGVIDGHGRLVAKDDSPKPKVDSELDDIFNPGRKPAAPGGETAVAEIVNRALAPILEKLKTVENDNSYLYHQRMVDKLSTKYSLEEGEASQLLAQAARDRGRSLDEHAKAFVSSKQQSLTEMEKRFATKYDLNLEELEQVRRTRDKDFKPTEVVPGKKFSFRRKGDDYVSPSAATKSYFKQVHSR